MSTIKDYSYSTEINYMICECGVDFRDVEELTEHLQNNHIVKEEPTGLFDEDDCFYILEIEQKSNDIKQENDEPLIKSEVLPQQDESSTDNINEMTIAPVGYKDEYKNESNDSQIADSCMSEYCETEVAINEIHINHEGNVMEHHVVNNSNSEYHDRNVNEHQVINNSNCEYLDRNVNEHQEVNNPINEYWDRNLNEHQAVNNHNSEYHDRNVNEHQAVNNPNSEHHDRNVKDHHDKNVNEHQAVNNPTIEYHDRNVNEHQAVNNPASEYRVIKLIPNNQERLQVRINGKLVVCRRVNSVNFANEIASEVVIPNSINFINAVNEEEVVTEEIPFNELIQEHANTDYGHLKFCEMCQEVFVDDKLYKVHCRKVHKKIQSERPKKKLIPKKSQCDVCGRVCASKASLRTHMSIHNGLKPFGCLTCGKHFAFKIRLQVHMRIHTGERPYQCQLCPKAFRNKAAINRHLRVHTGARPYACPECGKAFTQSNSMKWHVRTVHLKEPWPYKSKKRRQAEMERKAKLMYRNSGVARSSESD